MTKQEFDKTLFKTGGKIVFMGAVFKISAIDFDDKKIGVYLDENDIATFQWVKCSEVEAYKTE